MANNVRCIGQPVRGNLWDPPFRPPCGWTGERRAGQQGRRPRYRWESGEPVRKAPTDDPCPRCGGKVELKEEPAANGAA